MSYIRKFGKNTLDIRLGISQDQQDVNEIYKIKDAFHHKVLKAKHRRTEAVNVKIKSEANTLKFENDGKKDTEWCCKFGIPPKYKNGTRYVTDPKYKSTKLHHDSPGDQDRINTTVKSKNDTSRSYDTESDSFAVELK